MTMYTGEDIRKIRLALGLTMREFGERLGSAESTVSRWEEGERHPRFGTLVKINLLAKEAEKKGLVLAG